METAKGNGFEDWPAFITTFWVGRLGLRKKNNKFYTNLVKGLALYMTKLSARSFSGVGTLMFAPNGEDIVVGPLLDATLQLCLPAQLQVYATAAECYVARIDHTLHVVHKRLLGWDTREGFLYRLCRGDPVWRYITLLEAKRLVQECEDMNRPQPTYLRHTDDHHGQYLATKEGHLSSVIDWE